MMAPANDVAAARGSASGERRLEAIGLCLLPGALLAVVVLAAWPGYLSWDSAYQFWQARHGRFGDIAPPLLPLLWRGLLQAGLPGPVGPLLLAWLLYAIGFATFAATALRRGQRRLAWTIAIAGPLCPTVLILLPHIWTDVLLAGSALSAAALIADDRRGPLRTLAIAVLLCAVAALRHNGILAAAPLLFGALWLRLPRRGAGARRSAMMLWTAALVGIVGMYSVALLLRDALVEQRVDTWAVTPLYDLQAVSIATGTQRIPASLVGAGLDVDELVAAFHPHSATWLFARTSSGVVDPTSAPLSREQRDDLRAAWRESWATAAYWAHRTRLFVALLGPQHGDLRGLAESPRITPFADNPPIEGGWPGAHARYRALLSGLHRVGLYSGGAIWLLGSLIAAARVRRRERRHRQVVWMLLGSAACYAIPYFWIAPSAELRYLLWPALAGWIALLLVLGASRAERNAPPS